VACAPVTPEKDQRIISISARNGLHEPIKQARPGKQMSAVTSHDTARAKLPDVDLRNDPRCAQNSDDSLCSAAALNRSQPPPTPENTGALG
jgi:hypothetical protein